MQPAEPDSATCSASTEPVLFDTTPPHPALQVSVVIPARNEAHHLIDTLDALRRQHRPDGSPLPPATYEILLLLNNCTDTSEQVARHYQQQFPAFPLRFVAMRLPAHRANVGTARRLLMDAACQRLQHVNPAQGIIASTDGDTVVDTHWLHHIIETIGQGNEAVGGRILTRASDCPVRVNHLRDVTYRMLIAQLEAREDPQPNDPWPRHFQHFGANMAVTCTAYLRAGGLPDVPHLEDEALYQALLRTDARIRKSPSVRAFTSTRLNGRASVGFSEQLRYWQQQNQHRQYQLAEPAEGVLHRLRCRHQLRVLWQERFEPVQDARTTRNRLTALAAAVPVTIDWLDYVLGHCRYFGEAWEQVDAELNGRWAAAYPPVPITQAITDLRHLLHSH